MRAEWDSTLRADHPSAIHAILAASVIGHGILISEPEARLRRIEQHLDLPPLDAH